MVGALLLAGSVSADEDDLLELSLEELMNVEVTSVSKKAESRNDAAAAITVITAEDIRRSGLTQVPELLRLVPGVQVARIDASRWAISIRGFNQEFANKLLVMIDGRTLYTPVFGGVVWYDQLIAIEDIERIEVIRGPGGTIWGVNAVNGVINVITKRAEDTQGSQLTGRAGTQDYGLGGRHGGRIGEGTHYRLSAKVERIEDFDYAGRSYDANDSWEQLRLAFRSDTEISERDALSVHVGYYNLELERGVGVDNPGFPFNVLSFQQHELNSTGGHVLAHYAHEFDGGSTLQAKAFYDRVHRETTIREDSHTAELSLQHDVELLEGVGVVWGADYRYWSTHTQPEASPIVFARNDDDFHFGSGFLQLKVDLLEERLSLIGGTKLSYNGWSGFEYQPSARLVAKPLEGHTLWAAVSRAVRTPTLVDRELAGSIGPVVLQGDRDVRSEELLSYEVGYRFYGLDWLSFEISAFWSKYEDISGLAGPPPIGPFVFDNLGDTTVRGGEIEVTVVPIEWWRVTVGYSILDIDDDMPISVITDEPGGGGIKKTHPRHQWIFRSLFDLPCDLELDVSAYYVDGLERIIPTRPPALTSRRENVTDYLRLDLRVGYRPLEWLEVSLVGQNLLDARHAEYDDIQRDQSSQVPRSGYAKVTFDF